MCVRSAIAPEHLGQVGNLAEPELLSACCLRRQLKKSRKNKLIPQITKLLQSAAGWE